MSRRRRWFLIGIATFVYFATAVAVVAAVVTH